MRVPFNVFNSEIRLLAWRLFTKREPRRRLAHLGRMQQILICGPTQFLFGPGTLKHTNTELHHISRFVCVNLCGAILRNIHFRVL